jgi:hypothetical protein
LARIVPYTGRTATFSVVGMISMTGFGVMGGDWKEVEVESGVGIGYAVSVCEEAVKTICTD